MSSFEVLRGIRSAQDSGHLSSRVPTDQANLKEMREGQHRFEPRNRKAERARRRADRRADRQIEEVIEFWASLTEREQTRVATYFAIMDEGKMSHYQLMEAARSMIF